MTLIGTGYGLVVDSWEGIKVSVGVETGTAVEVMMTSGLPFSVKTKSAMA